MLKIMTSFWFWMVVCLLNLFAACGAVAEGDAPWLSVVCFAIAVFYAKRALDRDKDTEDNDGEEGT